MLDAMMPKIGSFQTTGENQSVFLIGFSFQLLFVLGGKHLSVAIRSESDGKRGRGRQEMKARVCVSMSVGTS